jgi:hypothetical protein
VNGVVVASKNATVAVPVGALALHIGSDSIGQREFQGLIDEAEVFNRRPVRSGAAGDLQRRQHGEVPRRSVRRQSLSAAGRAGFGAD